MKNLKDIIIEKLIINKNTKVESYKDIDYDNPEDIANIYKAAFISIMKNKSYIEGPTFKKRLSKIQYNDIIDILNNVFEYDIDYDEGKIKKGRVWEIVSKNKISIQNLVNRYTILFKYDKSIELSGRKLREEYKDIIDKK
jgi:hypothetical protein